MTRIHTVDSFGPELMAALLRGSRSHFPIPMPSYRAAVRFQQRLNQLRKAMRETNHPMAPVVARASISIQWDPNIEMHRRHNGVRVPKDQAVSATVVIRPHDSEFASALLAAGIAPAELQNDPLSEEIPTALPPAPEPDPGSSVLDQILHRKPSS